MKRYRIIFSLLLIFGLNIHDCLAESIKMATTTSTENSGLLDILLPVFEERYGIKIYAIAIGTGKALRLAENCDVDLVMVHAPQLESEFVKSGFGIDRKTVFYNEFIIVGPDRDPARIRDLKNARELFRTIAEKRCQFISRGDGSGTHQKELDIWSQISIFPVGPWYIETGQGMGTTLIIADEKKGYCLVDRATFWSYEEKVDQVVLHDRDPSLRNIYSVIAVSPVRFSHVKYNEAKLFIDWISSEEG